MDIDPHPILPRPAQLPHPPLFTACTKKDTVTLAAEYGIGALVLGFAGVEEVAELRRIHEEGITNRTGDRFVSTVTNDHFSALCPTIALDDREEARQIGARGQRFFAQSIKRWYGAGPVPDEAVTPGADEVAAMRQAAEEHAAYLHESRIPVTAESTATFNVEHAYGTADDAIAYVERLQEAGADEVMCLIQMGTVPQEACLETIRQWARRSSRTSARTADGRRCAPAPSAVRHRRVRHPRPRDGGSRPRVHRVHRVHSGGGTVPLDPVAMTIPEISEKYFPRLGTEVLDAARRDASSRHSRDPTSSPSRWPGWRTAVCLAPPGRPRPPYACTGRRNMLSACR
ncbi:hypothetical protein [Streptomyces sp. NBC_01280]|uniref:hypothetical protein n=1 Tax=Streptomyces sp. NBC_01280 TaxID=2903810 RepID=UPI003FCD2259